MDTPELLIREVYRQWRSRQDAPAVHPGEEEFVSFIDGLLPPAEEQKMKAHILSCPACARLAHCHLVTQPPAVEPPPALLERTRYLLAQRLGLFTMDLVVSVKDAFMQIISASGDVLVGQEFVPAAVFRARQGQSFRDEVTVLKDFADIRVELKAEKKGALCAITVTVKDKNTQQPLPGMSIGFLRDGRELEAYSPESGKAVFEQVTAGRYSIEIASPREKRATLFVEIRM